MSDRDDENVIIVDPIDHQIRNAGQKIPAGSAFRSWPRVWGCRDLGDGTVERRLERLRDLGVAHQIPPRGQRYLVLSLNVDFNASLGHYASKMVRRASSHG